MTAPHARVRQGVDTRSGGLRGLVGDLALGVRLAVGRGSWVRLALTAAAVGLGVAVLLLAAALPGAQAARDERDAATAPVYLEEGEPAAVLYERGSTYYRGGQIEIARVDVVADHPPTPLGVDRLPEPGEMIVSPGLAEVLADDGALLRPRLPWTQVGVIRDEGVAAPNTLFAYVGTEIDPATGQGVTFGGDHESVTPVEIVLLSAVGAVVVLLPVLVLLAASTRIAAAARERRLAAFRLVGADTGQASRLASGEALVGAVAGVGVGIALFLVGREVVEHLELLGISVFADDLRPSAPLLALVVTIVPTLAVATAVLSLRRAVIDPLGATRESSAPRRRLWWRLIPPAVGVALLVSQAGVFGADELPGRLTVAAVLTGLVLTGISVPLLLPWLIQVAVGPLSGGPPSWQLAIRRIQLDSGTSARAAGGLAAVLTAAVAFQTLLASAFVDAVDWERQSIGGVEGRIVSIMGSGEFAPAVTAGLAGIAGVRHVRVHAETYGELSADESMVTVHVASCETIRTFVRTDDCADGDAFIAGQPADGGTTYTGFAMPEPGATLTFTEHTPYGDPVPLGTWDVPAGATTAETLSSELQRVTPGAVFVTPSLAPPYPTLLDSEASVVVDPRDRDVAEHIANVFAATPGVVVYSFDGGRDELTQLRNVLVVGAIVVLLLAAASLLIVSVEQVRERRRQLAALAASGVGVRTLAASILWQAAVPFGVATVASLGVGAGLGTLLMAVFHQPTAIDWSGMALLVGAATVAVLAVTGLTLPFLRHATRPESLRME